MMTDAKIFLIIPLKQQLVWKDLCSSYHFRMGMLLKMTALVEAALRHPWLSLLESNARAAILCFCQLEKIGCVFRTR